MYKPKLGLLPVCTIIRKFLVVICTNFNSKLSQNGESVLHGAAMFGQLDTVRLLLKAGADSTLMNREGNTPYQMAVKCQHPHVADYFKSIQTPKQSMKP